VIPSSECNHGRTRQLIIDQNPEYDIYVFLTQDAHLATKKALGRIIEPFTDPLIGAVSGRQLPQPGATDIATHARMYNYPVASSVKAKDDISRIGIKSAFLSNSFAAYCRSDLMKVGGFPANVIFGEDTYIAAKMLLAGLKIAYCAPAAVYHSHKYTIRDDFRLYFDIGVFHSR
jgi:rhamnosyltransferase